MKTSSLLGFKPRLRILFALLAATACLPPMMAAEAPKAATPAEPPQVYQLVVSEANIAPTISMPTKPPEVVGQHKNETTHPNLIWDQDDVDH